MRTGSFDRFSGNDSIGKLDQRVEFRALLQTNDGGALIKSWPADSPPDSVWAEIRSQRGSEAFEAARVNARETIRVRVRYRDDITTDHILVFNGQNYDVKYLDHTSRRDGYLWLTAELNGAP